MKKSFALTVQSLVILVLLASFVMMAQSLSHNVFKVGITLLIGTAICQIAVGNINLNFNAKRWIRSFLTIFMIIEQVILISLLISPLFLNRQFVQAFLWVLILGTAGLFMLFVIRGSGTEK